MAISPPPYDEIDGIYIQIDKHVDAALFTGAAPQDGNARPGQILVDTSDYNVYVGNDSGNVRLIGPSLTQTSIDNDSITIGFSNQNQQLLLIDSSQVVVPNNSNVALPIGYALTMITGDNTSGYVTVQGAGVTRIYVSGQTGAYVENSYDNIEIPQYTLATIIKTDTDTWFMAGAGLTENYC